MSEQAVETGGAAVVDPAVIAVAAAEADDSPEAVFAGAASEMGWSPKDRWKGDPEKWVDAKTFILNTPKALKAAKQQVERVVRVSAEQMEKLRTDAMATARAEVRAAAASGDPDQIEAAAENLARASQKPDPAVAKFAASNAWFDTDEAARNVAIAVSNKVAQSGGSVSEQLEAAEKEVRKRFPEYFEDDDADPAPQRKQPPAVEGGQRTASPSARKTGWNDLPNHVKSAWSQKRLSQFGMTQAEVAESYFKEYAQ